MSRINASEKACVTHRMLNPVKNEERERETEPGTGWFSQEIFSSLVFLHLWKGALRALS